MENLDEIIHRIEMSVILGKEKIFKEIFKEMIAFNTLKKSNEDLKKEVEGVLKRSRNVIDALKNKNKSLKKNKNVLKKVTRFIYDLLKFELEFTIDDCDDPKKVNHLLSFLTFMTERDGIMKRFFITYFQGKIEKIDLFFDLKKYPLKESFLGRFLDNF